MLSISSIMGKRKRAVPPGEECSTPSKRITRSASRKCQQGQLEEGKNAAVSVTTPPHTRGGGTRSGSGSSSHLKSNHNQSQDPGQREELPEFNSSSPHPLYNQVILSKLFSLCSHKDLATCRRVCKTWRDTSLPNWTSTSTVKISDDNYLSGPLEDQLGITVGGGDEVLPSSKIKPDPRRSRTTFHDFLNYWERECRTWTSPYTHFHLKSLDFGLSQFSYGPPQDREAKKKLSARKQEEIGRFFELVGGSIKSLTLERCWFADAETVGKVLYQSFPILESLTLNGIRLDEEQEPPQEKFENPEYYEGPLYGEHPHLKSLSVITEKFEFETFPVPWIELLSHFSSLTSLKLCYPQGYEQDYGLSYSPESQNNFKKQVAFLLKAVQLIRSGEGSKLPLTDFDIDPAFSLEVSNSEQSNSISSLMLALKLPRKSAKIRFDCEVAHLQELVKAHGDTLTKLDALMDGKDEAGRPRGRTQEVVGIPSPSFPCSFPFGNMLENLQELTISNRFSTNLEFLRYTPNLGRLRIFDGVLNYHQLRPIHTNLVSHTPKTDMENVRLLKLKRLYLGYVITPNDLRSLVTWLPNVEMLSMFLDNGQFSMVCASWRDLRHLHCLGHPQIVGMKVSDQGITGITRARGRKVPAINANITYLTKLTCFKIAKDCSSFSELSVYNGFLKLPNLRTLDIAINNPHFREEAWDSVKKLLKEKVPGCSLFHFRTMKPANFPRENFQQNHCGYVE